VGVKLTEVASGAKCGTNKGTGYLGQTYERDKSLFFCVVELLSFARPYCSSRRQIEDIIIPIIPTPALFGGFHHRTGAFVVRHCWGVTRGYLLAIYKV